MSEMSPMELQRAVSKMLIDIEHWLALNDRAFDPRPDSIETDCRWRREDGYF